MAGQKFQYDESGSTFLYFLISFLGLVLVPCTFYFGPSDSSSFQGDCKNKDACNCKWCFSKAQRLKKPERWKGFKKNLQRLLLAAGWAFFAFLVYKVQEFDYEYANFDPYDILNVGLHATPAEIKKAYRKLSLIYHPDKTTGDEKKFMKLNKAYQALTDDTARRNYELYGNPDGPGAMNFGIALPSWIIEKENSILVLGVYTLVFMFALPTVVAVWWYRSSKFTNDQVLMKTTQYYYYFIHKTPQMMFRRALMILAGSLEYDRDNNRDIQVRPSDNMEVPALMRMLPNLGEKNRELPLCLPYSIKARALYFAHLARIRLNVNTLDVDRLAVIRLAPTLINEMVSCFSQVTMLALAGKISRMPSLDTVENIMKLSPHIVQALSETKYPISQLPYIKEEHLKFLQIKKKPIRTIQQFAKLCNEDRRNCLKFLTDEEFENVNKACATFPDIELDVECEVVDDEDSAVFTAGAMVTVTATLLRTPINDALQSAESEITKDPEIREEQKKEKTNSSGWKPKNIKVKKKKKASSKSQAPKPEIRPQTQTINKPKPKINGTVKAHKATKSDRLSDEDSDLEKSGSHSDESIADEADSESHNYRADDDDLEWEKCQRGLTKKEKVLEGKSKVSHPVHCPWFTEEKQEYWWIYICDKKKRMLMTVPFHVTNLVDKVEVQLRFTAPMKPGHYTFQVCLRSDSYLGFDVTEDVSMDVQEAREIPTAHPQWEEFSSEEDEGDEAGEVNESDLEGAEIVGESEFASDSDFDGDSDY